MPMVADVVAVGEGLLRMSPVGADRFEQTDTFRMYVGGTEVNTLVGLSRLGRRTLWLSRVTQNVLGDRLVAEVAAHGVDVGSVVRPTSGRVGCYWLEKGSEPRENRVTYDRSGSAMTHFGPNDLPRDLFAPGGAHALHTSGITLALSDETRATVLESIRRAKRAGWTIAFDTNYRHQLWSPEQARKAYSDALALADIMFVPRTDAETVLGASGMWGTDEVLRHLAAAYPGRTIVITDGAQGAKAITAAGDVFEQDAFRARAVDRVGRGDAFVAGFLHAVLETSRGSRDVRLGLRWGAAMAALKFATPGDLPLVARDDVEALALGEGGLDDQH